MKWLTVLEGRCLSALSLRSPWSCAFWDGMVQEMGQSPLEPQGPLSGSMLNLLAVASFPAKVLGHALRVAESQGSLSRREWRICRRVAGKPAAD